MITPAKELLLVIRNNLYQVNNSIYSHLQKSNNFLND